MPIGSRKEFKSQDNDSQGFIYRFFEELKNDIGLLSPVNPGISTTISVSPGHGIVIGNLLTIWQYGIFGQYEVSGVSGDEISINVPFDIPFTPGARIIRGGSAMNVDGSSINRNFTFKIYDTIRPVAINTMSIFLQHAAEADDSKFGGITALTNGVIVRKFATIGLPVFNLARVKSNNEFKKYSAKVAYTDKAGGGNFSTQIDITFNTRESVNIVLVFNPKNSEFLEIKIRDNLSTLLSSETSVYGRFLF